MWPFGRSETGGDKDQLGRRGEKLAARFLRRTGLKILARNYRCPSGEADIIALDGGGEVETIVFVEVKTRSSARHVDPESAVDGRKQRQVARAAQYYLSGRDAGEMAVRFDVVSVLIVDGGEPEVRHIVDAFTPGRLG